MLQSSEQAEKELRSISDRTKRRIVCVKGFYRIALMIGFILMTVFAQAEGQTETFHADVGSIVTFGRYEQDGNLDNGQEKIEWIVLDVQKERCLLLSRYCLDTKSYHSKGKNITWKDCTLRKWLNHDFLNTAFVPQEQEVIAVTAVDNSRKQGYRKWKKTKGGKNTRDRIFLLSCAEAGEYFNVAFHGPLNLKSCAEPTPYAVGKGAYCEVVRGAYSPDTQYAWWWLRSPGYVQNAAAGVGGSGTLLDSSVNWEEACVRPALWVKLDQRTGIFLAQQPLKEKKTCGDYTYAILENGSAEIIRYSGKNDAVIIPSALDGYPVSAIGEAAFEGCSYVTSVVIPDGVKTIGDDAFLGCRGLISVTIPDSTETIGTASFTGCAELTSVTVPNGVRIIGRDAFFGCKGLTSITIPDSTEEIGNSAFAGCTGLTSITIPDNVKTLGEFVFHSCTGLTSVTLSDSCAAIPDFAFSECKSLTSMILPQSVRTIGTRAFWGCASLTSLIVPEGVVSIGQEAFGDCESLVSVTIPDSVTSVGASPFTSSSALQEAMISSDHPYLELQDNVLFSKSDQRLICCLPAFSEEAYTIPEGILEIGERAFWGCEIMTSVTIPATVTTIGDEAFGYCSELHSVRIPANVTTIGENAFDGCSERLTAAVDHGSYAERYCKKHRIKRSN